MNIVLVDDDVDYLELCCLAAEEYCRMARVHAYTTARSAIAAAGEWRTEARLIVLDYHLAGRTAVSVISDLRAEGCMQPFGVLSSATSEAEKQLCRRAGALAVLDKPGALPAIATQLMSLLRLSHLGCTTSAGSLLQG